MQQHGRALHHAVAAADGDRVQVDRHVAALAAHDVDAADRLDARSESSGRPGTRRRRCGCWWVLYMSSRLGRNMPAEGGLAAHAGEPFDAGVPQHDAAVGVDEQHAVVHVVDQHFLEQRHRRGGRETAVDPLVAAISQGKSPVLARDCGANGARAIR